MKKVLAILFVLLISQVVFAQTKIEDVEGDFGESDKLKRLIEILKKEPESKGLITIQNIKSKEGLGNILGYIEGAKAEIKLRLGKDSIERVSFAIVEGKKNDVKEFWLIPKGKNKPKIKEIKLSLNKIKTKFFYANMCRECSNFSPAIDSKRPDFFPFAQALKKNSDYRGLIVVHTTLINVANMVKDDLVREFDLTHDQIDVEVGEKYEIIHPVYDFYIIPKSNKIKRQ